MITTDQLALAEDVGLDMAERCHLRWRRYPSPAMPIDEDEAWDASLYGRLNGIEFETNDDVEQLRAAWRRGYYQGTNP